jgi:selenocysteine lyase/cysteine desulfurase
MLKINRIQDLFIGLHTRYPTRHGHEVTQCYLDSTASSLAFEPAVDFVRHYLPHHANVHSENHYSAKISTQLFRWATEEVLRFVNADPQVYTCIFLGSGATAGISRAARVLQQVNPKPRALVSLMEHHSNDLPHRQHLEVSHIALLETPTGAGCVDVAQLEQQLSRGDVSYVAVTGVSNVTGIINPVAEIVRLAHQYQSYVLIDAAQMGPHMPINLDAWDADALVLSGHKLYAPGSPGALIIRKSLLDLTVPVEVGGGMVEDVSLHEYTVTSAYPDRELAGTPNIAGSILLGATTNMLRRIGMQDVLAKEQRLTKQLLAGMAKIPHLTVYGSLDASARVGVVSFNLQELPHQLTAMILNDFFGIAVRNQCFCAHPYVRVLMREELWDLPVAAGLSDEQIEAYIDQYRGMVRISLGLYNTEADIERVLAALADIAADVDYYKTQYRGDAVHGFRHQLGELPIAFSHPERELDRWIDECGVRQKNDQEYAID